MTSEELNRAIEFIIQHGAQLDLRLEKLEKMHERDHELLAQVTLRNEQLDKMIEIESRRLEQEHRDHVTLIDVQSNAWPASKAKIERAKSRCENRESSGENRWTLPKNVTIS